MTQQLIDSYGRIVDYVRLSVTDRCDFRCVYCMAEDMQFLPRDQVMSIEEIKTVAQAFTELGVKRLRITGGEPLVRRGFVDNLANIGKLPGLEELLITTNGSQLTRYSEHLRAAGINRVNISLDSLREDRFKAMTRNGDLNKVLSGIESARQAGFDSIKLNAVVMKGSNFDEVLDLVEFARTKQLDIAFIEEMPLGVIDSHNRALSYCSSDEVKARIEERYELMPMTQKTAGPSRYFQMHDSSIKVGFISPHSHNFCADCNRVRVSVEGRLLLCLGNEHSVELLPILRKHPGKVEPVKEAIIAAMPLKPEKHHFDVNEAPQILRFMNATGG